MHNLSSFQRDLLITVAGMGPISGTEIKDHIEERWGEEVNHSRLYPNLEDLAMMNLIRINKNTGGRHNHYSVMPMGERNITSYREWESNHLDEEEDAEREENDEIE
ncbi:PadR family transcriptional regulator (plasmid) [Salinirubellus salinus]|uniref:PadR family transcriptional regulator n=2 Tax=Salinirubellus salinus TaxID=1364945 RepID=A0A9E7UD38_9EURY|nr:PadR family transcriptional regulator [Salinirubellus salinus]UWM56987.1 PadR family transcriptional regulator [Salinirubellus salinus]UWM57027.1 PadR family transcriptional regulator [Salinirubellus salinus]